MEVLHNSISALTLLTRFPSLQNTCIAQEIKVLVFDFRKGVKNRRIKKNGKSISKPSTNSGNKSKRKNPAPADVERGKKISSPSKGTSGRRNIQVVYRPPFSVKVEFVREEPESKGGKLTGNTSKNKGENNSHLNASKNEAWGNPKSNSSTVLQRRTSKALGGKNTRNPKSELQILIPKIQEDDDTVTPQPNTS